MRVARGHRRTTVSMNMTPMIDVVFLLIIFFLVSSHLARQETQLELALPRAGSGQELVDSNNPRITVNVLGDGRLRMGGRDLAPDELGRQLRVEQARVGQALEVRIRGDRTAPFTAVEPILVECAKAGVWNVTFAVYERES